MGVWGLKGGTMCSDVTRREILTNAFNGNTKLFVVYANTGNMERRRHETCPLDQKAPAIGNSNICIARHTSLLKRF